MTEQDESQLREGFLKVLKSCKHMEINFVTEDIQDDAKSLRKTKLTLVKKDEPYFEHIIEHCKKYVNEKF